MSLNEQLAELCDPNTHDAETWNPVGSLNQLRMCYEALSDEQRESFAYENRYAPTDWAFTNPELVAQAILKAKEVS